MNKIIKLGLILIAILTYVEATEVKISRTDKNGAVLVQVDSLNIGIADWIAIYPKNSNTDWANVLDWKWAKDLHPIRGTKYVEYRGAYRINNMGDYKVQYFKNNTFNIHKSLPFQIKNAASLVESLNYRSPFDGFHEIWIDGFTPYVTAPAQKDWIGIYKKNDDNSWRNMIEWVWAKKLNFNSLIGNRESLVMTLDGNKYQSGVEYEARYFLNNSYTVEVKSPPFQIKNAASLVKSLNYRSPFDGFHEIWIDGFTPNVTAPAQQDWIGIYKKNDDNSWGNMIEWVWAKKLNFNSLIGNRESLVMTLDGNKYQSGVEYEARYFLNNSYTVAVKSPPFSLLDL